MFNKHTEMYSTSLVIRKMKIKNTVRFHQMAYWKKNKSDE